MREPGRRRQPQCGADGAAAGGTAGCQFPGTTVNRLCGSGMDAVGSAARAIACGEAELVIAGGVESMSRAPFVMGKGGGGLSALGGDLRYDDRLAICESADARHVRNGFDAGDRRKRGAGLCGVERAAQDAFALRSQMRAARAMKDGFFDEEIVPVEMCREERDDVSCAR